MERQDKIEMIVRKVNILDLSKREHLVKMLLAYEVVPKQTNNGVYCMTDQLSDEVIDVIYDYLLVNLK
jgi:predicted transcriptional regulator